MEPGIVCWCDVQVSGKYHKVTFLQCYCCHSISIVCGEVFWRYNICVCISHYYSMKGCNLLTFFFWKTKTCNYYTIHAITDGLAQQGAWASANKVLTWFPEYFSFSPGRMLILWCQPPCPRSFDTNCCAYRHDLSLKSRLFSRLPSYFPNCYHSRFDILPFMCWPLHMVKLMPLRLDAINSTTIKSSPAIQVILFRKYCLESLKQK